MQFNISGFEPKSTFAFKACSAALAVNQLVSINIGNLRLKRSLAEGALTKGLLSSCEILNLFRVPVQKIWLDTAEQKETPVTSFASSSDESVLGVMKTLFNDMIVRKGMSSEDARARLSCTDPFQNFPHLIAQLSQPDE